MNTTVEHEGGLEETLARFLVNFNWTNIGSADLPAVKAIIKDQLALQISAVELPWSKDVRRSFAKLRPGNASIVGESILVDPADAAYFNATYGHGFEYDDVASNAHPGCCVVPTALAVGEELGATLGQVVEAMVAGYEVYVRLGRLAMPFLVTSGWHAHSVLANFGAAAVTAKLYSMDERLVSHALAIALSHAGGTTEYTLSGGSIKRAHAGIGVRNGIEAAALARNNVTGPANYLTGKKGFFQNFIRRGPNDDLAMFDLERPLRINDGWIKAYCCCGAHHAYLDAMKTLQGDAHRIVAVDANVQTMTAALADNPHVQQHGTANIEELQFSLALQMAMAVLGKGNGYAVHRDFLAGRVNVSADSDVVQFARRIRINRTPELDTRYPYNFVADMVIHYDNGESQHLFVEAAKGTAENPFTAEEHRGKLDELTVAVIGQDKTDELFGLIDAMDKDRPISDVTRLLRWS